MILAYGIGFAAAWWPLSIDRVDCMKTRLRVLRAEHELTQEALADRVGVSRQAINAIETGRYEPSLSLAIRIAKLFNQPVEQIFIVEEER